MELFHKAIVAMQKILCRVYFSRVAWQRQSYCDRHLHQTLVNPEYCFSGGSTSSLSLRDYFFTEILFLLLGLGVEGNLPTTWRDRNFYIGMFSKSICNNSKRDVKRMQVFDLV